MSKKSNAAESLWYKGVEAFSSGDESIGGGTFFKVGGTSARQKNL